MNRPRRGELRRLIRPAIFLIAAAVHAALLFFLAFRMETAVSEPEPPLAVMKLFDIREEAPPPPPPREEPPKTVQTTLEAVAETMIETDEVPPMLAAAVPQTPQPAAEEFLPQFKISEPPKLTEYWEKELLRTLEYPAIALRSRLEGTAYLELYIDKQGNLRRVVLLNENPPDRGFGEAAVKAFQNLAARGLRFVPAMANGVPAAVRYRYPMKFIIKR